MKTINIAIADDYQVFRDGLKVILSADENVKVCLEAANGEELINGLANISPDVIIMDIKMPVMDGMEATRIVRGLYPSIKVLVVSMYEDETFLVRMMENGAHGYLLKNAEPEEIRRSIYSVYENGYYFSSWVDKNLVDTLLQNMNRNADE